MVLLLQARSDYAADARHRSPGGARAPAAAMLDADMPRKRRPITFRQADVVRLLRSYEAAGVTQPTVRITKEGDLIAIPSNGPKDNPDNPWDEVLPREPH